MQSTSGEKKVPINSVLVLLSEGKAQHHTSIAEPVRYENPAARWGTAGLVSTTSMVGVGVGTGELGDSSLAEAKRAAPDVRSASEKTFVIPGSVPMGQTENENAGHGGFDRQRDG
jgi:hypothetical protein